jgi:hypothetical protein
MDLLQVCSSNDPMSSARCRVAPESRLIVNGITLRLLKVVDIVALSRTFHCHGGQDDSLEMFDLSLVEAVSIQLRSMWAQFGRGLIDFSDFDKIPHLGEIRICELNTLAFDSVQ